MQIDTHANCCYCRCHSMVYCGLTCCLTCSCQEAVECCMYYLVQAVLEPQQRHGFCVSVRLSGQLASTTIRLISQPAADLPDAQRPHTPEQSLEPVVMQHHDTGSQVVS
jgi:hypothetical protein